MSEIKDILATESAAVEQAETRGDAPIRSDVKVSRGHDRAKTLQIRLNESELAEIAALADTRGLPLSTVARQLLLQSLAPEEDLRAALDRLEGALSAVRRKALSA